MGVYQNRSEPDQTAAYLPMLKIESFFLTNLQQMLIQCHHYNDGAGEGGYGGMGRTYNEALH